MADGKIYKGKNVRLSYNGKTLYHTTSCKLDISTSIEEIATKDTDGSVNTPGNYTWNVSAEALMADIPTGNLTQIAGDDLIDFILEGTELNIEFSTNEVASYKYIGKVYVESASVDATVGQSVTGSFAFKGNGDLTKEVVLSPNPLITSSPNIAIEDGVAGSFQVTATNGTMTNYGFTGVDQAPAGVTINSGTGLISWTDTVTPGTYPVLIVVSNNEGNTTQAATIVVS